jgi:hypothetical protein
MQKTLIYIPQLTVQPRQMLKGNFIYSKKCLYSRTAVLEQIQEHLILSWVSGAQPTAVKQRKRLI